MEIDSCDPGAFGAFAVYDGQALQVLDMPTFIEKAGKLGRPRRFIDPAGVVAYLTERRLMGGRTLVMERVGGIPGQAAHAAFVFGHGAGLIMGAAMALGFTVHTVPAARWKGAMRVPADKDLAVKHADALLPDHAHLWRVERGSVNKLQASGRAEAALIGAYGRLVYGQGEQTNDRP